MNRQPLNSLAQWGIFTDNGEYVGVEAGGFIASRATINELIFSDGSTMQTAGIPNRIDAGTF